MHYVSQLNDSQSPWSEKVRQCNMSKRESTQRTIKSSTAHNTQCIRELKIEKGGKRIFIITKRDEWN